LFNSPCLEMLGENNGFFPPVTLNLFSNFSN
jgi:hypothetical protein